MGRLLCLAVALLLAGSQGVRADEAPSTDALKAAKELFAVISPDTTKQLMTQMTNAVWPGIEQKLRAANVDDATAADLRKEFDRVEASFIDDAMKDAPAVYARHFTAAELRQLIDFYRTPLGAKALREMPKVTGEFMALLVPRLQDLQRQVRDSFEQTLRSHGYVK